MSWDSYATTMKSAFTPKSMVVTAPVRKKGLRRLGYTYELGDPLPNHTLYNDEYSWKVCPREELIPTAAERGVRGPSPRLSQEYWQWTLPPGHVPTIGNNCFPRKAELFKEVKKALANQFVSITKMDFVDRAAVQKLKGSQVNSKQKSVPRPDETEFRQNYQVPLHRPEYQDFSFKYGCYSSLPCASQGIVPSVLQSYIRNQELTKDQTTYQTHYGNAYLDFLMILNSFSPSQIAEYLNKISYKDRKIIECFIHSQSDTGQGKTFKRKLDQMKAM
ncbi:testis-expressed protein 26 [Tenrec ecaudatus]|uniref:testis-expressed protein 26 n=1 Tax=Tenrec ecaudatus TaxID=94439 RepID=UPI003F5A52B5